MDSRIRIKVIAISEKELSVDIPYLSSLRRHTSLDSGPERPAVSRVSRGSSLMQS